MFNVLRIIEVFLFSTLEVPSLPKKGRAKCRGDCPEANQRGGTPAVPSRCRVERAVPRTPKWWQKLPSLRAQGSLSQWEVQSDKIMAAIDTHDYSWIAKVFFFEHGAC